MRLLSWYSERDNEVFPDGSEDGNGEEDTVALILI